MRIKKSHLRRIIREAIDSREMEEPLGGWAGDALTNDPDYYHPEDTDNIPQAVGDLVRSVDFRGDGWGGDFKRVVGDEIGTVIEIDDSEDGPIQFVVNWPNGAPTMGSADEFELVNETREVMREALDQEFNVVPGQTHKGAFRIHTPQDGGTRDVVVLKHPDGDVQAYFQSSGRSGGGYAGSWIPFEGWATDARVPKGLSYDDPDPEHEWKGEDISYGHYALMAKTYWNQPNSSAKAPPGSSHDKASNWIGSWVESQGSLTLPTTTISNNIKQLGNINRWLWSVGAIDRSSPVLNVSASRGRRLQFGLDKVS